ncbi:DUF3750 domain-containing protein [Roseiconus nitratireducens]|uniref:DUF3750 domain-containing protein n=1 Tax=Roseiconus nitratireducens TaxID=2605748 RepID=A0A5M6CUJ7_9BACT|nr:DUF3750 domain-containing protein [Roseiconus nitratireducens]
MRQLTVELWAAPIPILGRFADHHWIVIVSDRGINRWEVWQKQHVVDTSWGYLHRNLLPPKANVGYGPSRHVRTWVDGDARDIQHRVENSPTAYPWLNVYRFFPGPNSNTFVEWALGDVSRLTTRAPGAWYARFAGRQIR